MNEAELKTALAEAEARIAELEAERIAHLSLIDGQADQLTAANKRIEELAQKYRFVEVANKEWTRNDAVTFGRLYEENQRLRFAIGRALEFNSNCINGMHRKFYESAEEDVRESQNVLREALKTTKGEG